jgi:hypothetical protein
MREGAEQNEQVVLLADHRRVLHLESVYHEIKKKVIPLIQQLRTGLGDRSEKWTHAELITLFSRCYGWRRMHAVGGHCAYQCRFTELVVGFSGHDVRELSVPAKISLMRDLQVYLNIFSNHIFKIQSWHEAEPDFYAAARRLEEFRDSKAEVLELCRADAERTISTVGSKVPVRPSYTK